MSVTTTTRDKIITALNDCCRVGLDRLARGLVTRGCLATFAGSSTWDSLIVQAQLMAMVRDVSVRKEAPCNDSDRSETVFAHGR